jgi:hypothetical protein
MAVAQLNYHTIGGSQWFNDLRILKLRFTMIKSDALTSSKINKLLT